MDCSQPPVELADEAQVRLIGEPLGTPLAVGATAEIYGLADGRALKLFFARFPQRVPEHEARLTSAVHQAGIPVPAVGPVVELDGRYGFVLEWVEGPSMFDMIASRPWSLLKHARTLARMHAELHSVGRVDGLPNQHALMERKIREADILPENLRTAAVRRLVELPEGRTLCHGDFHPGNILFGDTGPRVIDWVDASNGSPLADAARTSLLMDLTPVPDGVPGRTALATLRGALHAVYLRHYFRLRPGEPEELNLWRVVNAAARLSEGVPEQQVLIDFLRACL
jgi:aminoglycoside phosphotransferase (APT) family kinase protein